MPRFISIPFTTEAHQWFKHGDHPTDLEEGKGPLISILETIGDGVPDGYLENTCKRCSKRVGDHASIIDGPTGHVGPTVCPGDWIIEVDGVYTPFPPDQFKKHFKKVDEQVGSHTEKVTSVGDEKTRRDKIKDLVQELADLIGETTDDFVTERQTTHHQVKLNAETARPKHLLMTITLDYTRCSPFQRGGGLAVKS